MITKQKAFDFTMLVKELVVMTREILIMDECEKRILFRRRLEKTQELCRFKGKAWYQSN